MAETARVALAGRFGEEAIGDERDRERDGVGDEGAVQEIEASAPPTRGYSAAPAERTAVLTPSTAFRWTPSKASPTRVTVVMKMPAAAVPWTRRIATMVQKPGPNAMAVPATPNTNRLGTRTRRRPTRSTSKPMTGDRKIPVTKYVETSKLAAVSVRPRASLTTGRTGLISGTPSGATSVLRRTTRIVGVSQGTNADSSGVVVIFSRVTSSR